MNAQPSYQQVQTPPPFRTHAMKTRGLARREIELRKAPQRTMRIHQHVYANEHVVRRLFFDENDDTTTRTGSIGSSDNSGRQ